MVKTTESHQFPKLHSFSPRAKPEKYQRNTKAERKNINCIILLIASEAERKVLGGANPYMNIH